ncbi:MAG: D-alanine--D-alanine ligase [Aquiluna sp.]|nr:D-alanine--D-alanine ligase [Aquiluna sp.]MCF8545706.1 D-alanine--D-alanine ligase [Aquiluna sp.]
MQPHVLILSGGISHERDVSLKSGRRVADALVDAGARVEIREPDPELVGHLIATKPDVVWSTLHGSVGEDGSLQDLLELTGIPFVGSDADGARLAWNKAIAKLLLGRHGIQTPKSITLPKSTFRELNAEAVLALVATAMPFPLIVKPVKSGSAQGVSKVLDVDHFGKAMVDAFVYCDEVIIEHFVEGTELAISVVDLGFGPRALPPVEIAPESGQFGYSERYVPGETNYYVPARLRPAEIERAAEAAILSHTALRLRHLSRIDFIVDKEGVPWFLEANTSPGMTETSLFPQAIIAEGESLSDAYLSIAQAAIRS